MSPPCSQYAYDKDHLKGLVQNEFSIHGDHLTGKQVEVILRPFINLGMHQHNQERFATLCSSVCWEMKKDARVVSEHQIRYAAAYQEECKALGHGLAELEFATAHEYHVRQERKARALHAAENKRLRPGQRDEFDRAAFLRAFPAPATDDPSQILVGIHCECSTCIVPAHRTRSYANHLTQLNAVNRATHRLSGVHPEKPVELAALHLLRCRRLAWQRAIQSLSLWAHGRKLSPAFHDGLHGTGRRIGRGLDSYLPGCNVLVSQHRQARDAPS